MLLNIEFLQQNPNTMTDNATTARRLIREHYWGVLSTHSKKFPGYPFGSVVPVCPDYNGSPLILISTLAQHTQNIQQAAHVSLTLLDNPGNSVQTDARVTLLADAGPVPAEQIEAVAERYYRFFPDSRGYHTELDFLFYRLDVIAIRYIGGFGRIHWLAPDLLTANPFRPEEERGILDHMNADHANALADYWRHAGLPLHESPVTMVAMDAESIVLRHDQRMQTLPLLQPVNSPADARQCLVAMARQAREVQ